MFKKLVLTFVVVIVVIAGLLAIFVATFDANDYKQEITKLVKKQIGRDLDITGELKLAIYPDVALEMGKTSLSNAAGFSAEEFATFDSGRVSVKLMPLLKKQIQADAILLEGLKLELHRKSDGTTNWDDLVSSDSQDQSKAETKEPAKIVEEMLQNLSIAGISLKTANIHWRDDQAKQDISVSPLNLTTGKFTPGKPLPIELAVLIKQKSPALSIAAEGNTSVTLSNDNKNFKLSKLKLNTTITAAQIPNGVLEANISGDIKGSRQKINVTDFSLQSTLTGDLIPNGEVKSNITGDVDFDINAQQLIIAGMKATVNANGELLQGGKANTNINGDIQVDLVNSQIKSPQISLNTTVEGGLVPGGKLTQTGRGNLDLNWANNQGSVNLANLLVNVAGLEVKGSNVQLEPLAAKPAISGQFQTNTFNLKTLLKTLGIAPPVTSNPAAMSQVQAQFSLDASMNKADLKGLNLKLDKSQLSGNFGINNFTTPSIRTQLTINSINLDDYLAPSAKNTNATASIKPTSNSGSNELLPLEALRKLNIDGDFKIGSMIVNKLRMSNINAKIDAKQGLININPANAQLYKGKYVGRITIDARKTIPTMTMRHELADIRSEGLLFDLFQDKYISGGAKMTTELSSSGNTIDALLKNLNGNTSIGFNDGTIRDSNLAEKVSLAVKAFEKKEIKDGKSVVNFTGLSGDFKTTNGVFSTNNLSMLSPYFSINGSGTANVTNEKLNMKLRIGPKTQDPKRPLFAPLQITGTFSNPKFSLDLKDLIKALAAQDIKKLELEAKAKIEQGKQALKLKVENEKADAIQKLKNKTGGELGDQLINKLTGKKPQPADGSQSAPADDSQAPKEAPKSVEDQLKNKLKNKLKGLF